MPTARIAEALEDIREGKLVILVDDEDRENEGAAIRGSRSQRLC